MFTYQDLLEVPKSDEKRMEFVIQVINDHKNSDLYKTGMIAYDYARQRNRTISEYRKLLYTLSGEQVPDNYSANYKLCSNFFSRFITQQNQYLLGNGVSWENESTTGMLGGDFDTKLQELGREALIASVAWGFWNMDHVDVFNVREFAPLHDEENGALMAGVRFWQVASNKPLRATLYEIDGYTDFLWHEGKGEVMRAKRPYILKTRTTEADGTEIYDGENYPGFPIIPMWANPMKQSELVGIRENIDAYDLIKSGFANDLDDVSQIYWIIQNAGGMDEVDLRKFLDQIRRVKAAVVEDDGAKAEPHTIDIPYQAREIILTRLRNDMYDDFMALDVKEIAAGATTATQIKAAYEPMNIKTDQYEYCVIQFIDSLLELVGIEDSPTFTRSMIINKTEEIQTLIMSAEYVTEGYVMEKILDIFGDGDKLDDIKAERDAMDASRMMLGKEEDEEEPELEEEDETGTLRRKKRTSQKQS